MDVWTYLGGTPEATGAALRQEQVGVLHTMLRHDCMPPPGTPPRGRTSACFADTTVARLSHA
jgi:hypothetical protein